LSTFLRTSPINKYIDDIKYNNKYKDFKLYLIIINNFKFNEIAKKTNNTIEHITTKYHLISIEITKYFVKYGSSFKPCQKLYLLKYCDGYYKKYITLKEAKIIKQSFVKQFYPKIKKSLINKIKNNDIINIIHNLYRKPFTTQYWKCGRKVKPKDVEIYLMRLNGLNYQEIGQNFNYNAETCSDIYYKIQYILRECINNKLLNNGS